MAIGLVFSLDDGPNGLIVLECGSFDVDYQQVFDLKAFFSDDSTNCSILVQQRFECLRRNSSQDCDSIMILPTLGGGALGAFLELF